MRFSKYINIGLLFILILLVFQLVHLGWLANGKLVVQPFGDAEKTAIYLYSNPIPTLENLFISPSPSDMLDSDKQVCAYAKDKNGIMAHRWTIWEINGQSIPQWMYNVYQDPMLRLNTNGESQDGAITCLEFNVFRWLNDGTHLFRLHYRDNPFEEGLSYEWAFRVNNEMSALSLP